jgi:hypothetical protein
MTLIGVRSQRKNGTRLARAQKESIEHDGLIITSKEGNNNDLTIDQEIEYPCCHDIISAISHNFKEVLLVVHLSNCNRLSWIT